MKLKLAKPVPKMLWSITACGIVAILALAISGVAKSQAAAESAADSPTIEVTPAVSSDAYASYAQLAADKASDCKLTVIRAAFPIAAGESIDWAYLYGSKSASEYYAVFTGSTPVAAEVGKSYIKRDDFDAIPSTDEIKVDADVAYAAVTKCLSSNQPVHDVYAYITTYVETDSEVEHSTEYAYDIQPMVWYFEFNCNTGSDASGTSDESTSNENDSTSTEYPTFVYGVDARTGDVMRVLG